MHKLFRLASLLAVAFLPFAAPAQQQPIRIICGGSAASAGGGAPYTDSKRQIWQADSGFNQGLTADIPAVIRETSDQGLYQHQRYNNSGALIYTFSVPNGVYHVNLYFAETNTSLMANGARVFDVKMQGRPVFTSVDIFAEAGRDAALIKGSDVTVSDGKVAIEFDNVISSAKIDAIEILPGTSGPQLALNFRYPDGTAVVGNLTYTVSSSLLNFQGIEPLVNGQFNCALIANPSALGISMQFTIKATLADNAGNILWNLTLGMNPSQVNLATVQNSSLTVVVQKVSTGTTIGG